MANSFIAQRKEVELRGYFMRHKTGGDVGFSWNKDDPKFSDQWERIAAVPEATPPSPSTAPTVEVDERASFEREWLDEQEYATPEEIAYAWSAWQTRAALASKPPAREAAPLAYIAPHVMESLRLGCHVATTLTPEPDGKNTEAVYGR